jgi:hypothetical protein
LAREATLVSVRPIFAQRSWVKKVFRTLSQPPVRYE